MKKLIAQNTCKRHKVEHVLGKEPSVNEYI